MVSNTVGMDQDQVVAALQRLKAQHSGDPEYKSLRKALPKDWPI
jgi:hypothetical protein